MFPTRKIQTAQTCCTLTCGRFEIDAQLLRELNADCYFAYFVFLRFVIECNFV